MLAIVNAQDTAVHHYIDGFHRFFKQATIDFGVAFGAVTIEFQEFVSDSPSINEVALVYTVDMVLYPYCFSN